MILSDGDIRYELIHGELNIENLGNLDRQIQPCSVDIRLGDSYSEYDFPEGHVIDPVQDDIDKHTLEHEIPEEGLIVEPGETYNVNSMEVVDLPSYIKGQLTGRSSLGRLHVKVHQTAGLFDPGFRGTVVFEVANELDYAVRLRPGMRIGQMEFQLLESPAERPYGEERGSKYQGQEGAIGSRIHEDFE